MKVLVTGGAGFIASHIVDALLARGHEVAVVDNLATGSRGNLNPQARFYELSICEEGLAQVFAKEKPEIVNHHAAQMAVIKSVQDPAFDARENILGSLNLILNCLRFGVKKIVYASTGGAIYGDPKYLPVDEEHPINPLSPYGVSKHVVEHYLQLYWLQQGLEYVALRYPNVYGPRQNPQGEAGVVAIFAGQMLRGERSTIFGQGDKTRDYTHVSDIVGANLLAMATGKTGIYNLGTGIETSDQQLFDTLAEVLGYKGEPLYAPVRQGEIYRICLDATRARKELGWQPRLSLREGLTQAADYYRQLI